MFWSRAHSVRMGLMVAVALSCLAVTPPLFAAARGDSNRDRASRQERDAATERPGRETARERKPSESARVTARTQERPQARVVRSVPSTPSRDAASKARDATARASWQPEQRRAPVSGETSPRVYQAPSSRPQAAQPRVYQPQPVSSTQGWQRQPAERPSPYQLYRAPEQRATPDPPQRVVRAQPATPLARPGTEEPRRVDAPRVRVRVDRSQDNAWQRTPGQPRDPVATEQPRLSREQVRDQTGTQDRGEGVGRVDARPPQSGDRQYTVPRAQFRGPEAERDVKVVPRENRQRLQQQLQGWVREQNRGSDRPMRVLPPKDSVGNIVPMDTHLILRDRISRISVSYRRVEREFGAPSHSYFIYPRSPADYWDGYWDGYGDGYWAGKHHGHGHSIVLSFYYPYYWSDPHWLAFHYPGYYASVYHYWGWCPGWIQPARVYYVPVEYVYVPVTPYRYYNTSYAVDELGAQRAIGDIRSAWLNSEVTPLAAHLTDRLDIRVYFDGEYEYTTSTEDYYTMTVDAMATTQTVAMDFNNPIWISSHEVFYTGRHVFYDPNGTRQTVYVSYRLRRLGVDWYLVAVGSSLQPIRHQYQDFRYS
jgi:hypothetical protein